MLSRPRPDSLVSLMISAAIFVISDRAAAQTCTLPEGIVSWWPGDGNAKDIVGNNHGTLVNEISFEPGLVGSAFSFDGIDDLVVIPESEDLDFPPDASFTIELWAFRRGAGYPQHLFGKREGCGPGFDFYQVAFDAEIEPRVPIGVWTHLAVVVDAKNREVHIYANGDRVWSWPGVVDRSNDADITIGNAGTCTGFDGLIDDVAVYNIPLAWIFADPQS